LPAPLFREGAAAVRRAALTWQMPNVIVEQDPAAHEAWVRAMVAAVEEVLEP
jgi:hypothetical protein